jgi:hypothetical protein
MVVMIEAMVAMHGNDNGTNGCTYNGCDDDDDAIFDADERY